MALQFRSERKNFLNNKNKLLSNSSWCDDHQNDQNNSIAIEK